MPAAEKKTIVRIYIPLLNEGTPVIRPTNGEQIEQDVFRVLPAAHSETEEWQFPPGTLVRCAKEVWSGRERLVAKEIYVAAANSSQ